MNAITDGASRDVEVAHLADHSTLVLHLIVSDPEVIELAQRVEPDGRVALMKRCLRIGTLTLSAGQHEVSLTEIRRAEERLAALAMLPDEIAQRLKAALAGEVRRLVGDDERNGELRKAIDESATAAARDMRNAIEPIIDQLRGAGPEALPQLLEARVGNVVQTAIDAFMGRLLASDGTSPLMILLERNRSEMTDLRGDFAELRRELVDELQKLARDVVRERATNDPPTELGRSWESETLDDVSRVIGALGDTLDYTGKMGGHGRTLKGDGVLHVCAGTLKGLRVAIECRTGSERVTKRDLLAAVSNRDAHSGLLLSERPEGLPRDAEALGFKIYAEDRLVVLHYDTAVPGAIRELAVAVQVARMLARIATTAEGLEAELAALHVVTTEIETAVTELRGIRSATTAIDKETDRVRTGATAIERALRSALAGLSAIGQVAEAA